MTPKEGRTRGSDEWEESNKWIVEQFPDHVEALESLMFNPACSPKTIFFDIWLIVASMICGNDLALPTPNLPLQCCLDAAGVPGEDDSDSYYRTLVEEWLRLGDADFCEAYDRDFVSFLPFPGECESIGKIITDTSNACDEQSIDACLKTCRPLLVAWQRAAILFSSEWAQ